MNVNESLYVTLNAVGLEVGSAAVAELVSVNESGPGIVCAVESEGVADAEAEMWRKTGTGGATIR